METVRVSADLVLHFEADGKPRYKPSTMSKNEVDGRVKHWLSQNPDGTEKYSFVNHWYKLFELPPRPKLSYECLTKADYEYRMPPALHFPVRRRLAAQNTKGRPLLFAKGLSWCCRAQRVLVESMPGGFVTQNCVRCGRYQPVPQDELPDRKCETCATQLEVRMVDGLNYFYVCPGCGARRKLASLLPHYSELFGYEHSAI